MTNPPLPLNRPPCARKADGGLTLVELLITVAIIGVLIAILIPAAASMQEAGKRTLCLSRMKQLSSVILGYSQENDQRILPSVMGAGGDMNDTAWYEVLDAKGELPGGLFRNPGQWDNSIMACPSRALPPAPHWMGGLGGIHYAVNQHPGFLNRASTTTGYWPRMMSVKHPSRTYLLAEARFFLVQNDAEFFVYPHPKKDSQNGKGGMNLVFFDGHAEYLKGKLPALPGAAYNAVPYDSIKPEDSFPWY